MSEVRKAGRPTTKRRTEPSSLSSNGSIGKRLLNVRETAQYLGLKVDTVYKKARLRDLPSVKVGRALRFDLQALERFIESNAKPIL